MAGSSTSRGAVVFPGALAFVLVLVAVPTAAPASTPQVETVRTSYLGPEAGETLTSWTERWLEGPVQYVATEDEIDTYEQLQTTTQRLRFIRLFWERRDPTRGDQENAFMDEFVRRVEYAIEEFGEGELSRGGMPGWQTAFGRVVLQLGPPQRTERQLGFPSSVSQRPVILWSYDGRIPEWPINEMLMFVFQRGRWRLAPPSNFNEPPSAVSAGRDLERFNQLQEIPNDFLRATQEIIRDSLIQTVNYNFVVDDVEADVAFADAEIPFAWTPSFAPGEGNQVEVTLALSWRMESLVFHAVEEDFETRMVIEAVLFNDDDEPVAEAAEQIDFRVPAPELEARRAEIVERTLTLSAEPGTYRLRLVLDDHLLGFRTVYSEPLVVPSS